MQVPDTFPEIQHDEKIDGFKWIPAIGISILMLSYLAANVYIAINAFS
jgi:hypothetical protein